MNNRNMLIGIGMGMAMGSLGAMMLRPKKSRKMKSAVGKTLKSMSELAESVSNAMGW